MRGQNHVHRPGTDRQTDRMKAIPRLQGGGGVRMIRINLQTWSLYYHVKTLHLEVFTVSKKKIVTFYLKYNCRLEKNSCEKLRTVHLHVGSIQTDLARAWGQCKELDLSHSHRHRAVNLIVAVLYCHILLTLGGTHDFLNTPKISKGFTVNIIYLSRMLDFQQNSAYLSKACAPLNLLLLRMLCWNVFNLSRPGFEQQILLMRGKCSSKYKKLL